MKKNCVICGKEIEASGNNRKTCGKECGKKLYIQQYNKPEIRKKRLERMRAWHLKNKQNERKWRDSYKPRRLELERIRMKSMQHRQKKLGYHLKWLAKNLEYDRLRKRDYMRKKAHISPAVQKLFLSMSISTKTFSCP